MIHYLPKMGSLDSCCILHFMHVLSLCNKTLAEIDRRRALVEE